MLIRKWDWTGHLRRNWNRDLEEDWVVAVERTTETKPTSSEGTAECVLFCS